MIGKAGKPVARLVAIKPEPLPPRKPGRLKDRIKVSDEELFAPLPDEELALWEGR